MPRRGRKETQSVAGYRQTLDVLGHLGGGDRGIRRQGPEEAVAPHALYARHARPRIEPSRSFDDLGDEQPRREYGNVSRRDRSLSAMERPARRIGLTVFAVAVVLAVVGASAYLIVRSQHPAHPPRQSAGSHAHHHSPTPTTQPARYTAVSSTSTSATYAPTTSTYSLVVGATTSDCWMSVTEADGTTVLAQTFAPGATTQPLSLAGRATIVIGAPGAAALTINGLPVVLPSGVAGPLTVTLVPA